MLSKTRPSFSNKDKEIILKVPRDWNELTQEQLRYVFTLLLLCSTEDAKAYMLFRLSGLHIVRKTAAGWVVTIREHWWQHRKWCLITAESIASLLHQCDFIDKYDTLNTRLVNVGGYHAVDTNLHGVSFGDYLSCENLYQGYLMKKDSHLLEMMAQYLYRDEKGCNADGIRCDEVERFGCFLWWNYAKTQLASFFPHFFHRVDTTETGEQDMIAAMNTQIRALTDGDATKAEAVLALDCWVALTELDAKAKESAEFKRKYGRK